MAKNIKLYSNPGCPFAHRALFTIIEKGIDFEFVLIPLIGDLSRAKTEGVDSVQAWVGSGKTYEELQQIKDDYKANINSTGEVPTLVIDGKIVAEADVISEFLEDAFPDRGRQLMPQDAFQRAKVRHWLKVLSNNFGVVSYYKLLQN